MTQNQVTIFIALLGSPLFFAIFGTSQEWVSAKLRYRGWQAVFLNGGQVYFGKISAVSKSDIKLTSIYYLSKENKRMKLRLEDLDDDIKLIKLGNELHAPNDEMYISKAHIIFTESLRDDGNVVQAINKYNKASK
jgi:hypothetical protein